MLVSHSKAPALPLGLECIISVFSSNYSLFLQMKNSIVPSEIIEKRILLIRNQKVMLDHELALLYGIETKVLKQAVRRNIKRFPEDFMFILDKNEFSILRSQIVTSSWGGIRYSPMAFTEQGIAMLS